jgi:hypothetical protein
MSMAASSRMAPDLGVAPSAGAHVRVDPGRPEREVAVGRPPERDFQRAPLLRDHHTPEEGRPKPPAACGDCENRDGATDGDRADERVRVDPRQVFLISVPLASHGRDAELFDEPVDRYER